MTFQEFLDKLIARPASEMTVIINSVERKVRGITKLTSLNYRDDVGHYYKVFFTDNSLLIIMPKLEQVQFSEKGDLGAIYGVSNEQLGVKETIEFDGRTYKLENGGDYQYTLELTFGRFEDVEGECRFADYVNVANPDDCLSLGILSKDGCRADVHSVSLSLENIKIK